MKRRPTTYLTIRMGACANEVQAGTTTLDRTDMTKQQERAVRTTIVRNFRDRQLA